jgi:putative ABC transport system permease protein
MKRALRQLAKNPGFTIVALITLALGIGVNTTAFTLLNRLLLQALPFREPERLVQVWTTMPRSEYAGTAPADYFDEKEQNTVFTDMAAYVPGNSVSFAEPGQPALQEGSVSMTGNFFVVLGVAPELGRTPSPDEEARFEPVTLISDFFWRQHFGADPKVLGRSVRLDGKQYSVIGVMPPSADDPALFNVRPCFFVLDPTRVNRDLRDNGWYTVAARLRPGVTLKQAQGQLKVLASRFAHDHPKTNTDRGLRVEAYPTSQMGGTGGELTWMTLGLSGLVLLIACINLANLQLVRTTRRAPEIAIRLALGCPRRRLIGMLLLESLVLSVAGGALGILVAKWSNIYVARFFDLDMPLNLRVIGFVFVVSLAAGALFGTVPAWIASRTDVNASLKADGRGATSGRSRHWLRQGLVVVELAMALTLLAGAGFFVTGIYRLTHRSLGWDPTNEVLATIALDHDNFGEGNDPRSAVFSDRARAALQAIPGIVATSISSGSTAWGTRMETLPHRGPAGAGKGPRGLCRVFQRQSGMVRGVRRPSRPGPGVHRCRPPWRPARRHRKRVNGQEILAGREPDRKTDRRNRPDQPALGRGSGRHEGLQGRRGILQYGIKRTKVHPPMGPGPQPLPYHLCAHSRPSGDLQGALPEGDGAARPGSGARAARHH